MPKTHIIEIKYASKSMLPCPERRAGMTDDDAERKSASILFQIGRNLKQAHKKNLSRRGPPASRPGQYPRKVTGSLQRGIFCDPESSARIANSRRKTITIGYGTKAASRGKRPDIYGPHLVGAMLRKGIANTLSANRNKILAPARKWKPVEIIILRSG